MVPGGILEGCVQLMVKSRFVSDRVTVVFWLIYSWIFCDIFFLILVKNRAWSTPSLHSPPLHSPPLRHIFYINFCSYPDKKAQVLFLPSQEKLKFCCSYLAEKNSSFAPTRTRKAQVFFYTYLRSPYCYLGRGGGIRRARRALQVAEGHQPLQELEVGAHRAPYLLVLDT